MLTSTVWDPLRTFPGLLWATSFDSFSSSAKYNSLKNKKQKNTLLLGPHIHKIYHFNHFEMHSLVALNLFILLFIAVHHFKLEVFEMFRFRTQMSPQGQKQFVLK